MCSVIKKIVTITLATIVAFSLCKINAAALSPHAEPDVALGLESFSISERKCDDDLIFPDLASGLSDAEEGDCGSDSEVVVHGELTSLDVPTQPAGKYTELSWWLKVLSSAQEIARANKSLCYESIVKQSLTKNGYCLSTGGLSVEDAAGLGIVDFISTFNTRLDEFEKAMNDQETGYLTGIMAPENREGFLSYVKDSEAFGCLVQRKQMPLDRDYKITGIGDLHGDLISLLTSLKHDAANINDDFTFKNKDFYLVITGDFIDRCQFALEVLFIVIMLKIKNPENVILLLGNHELDYVSLASQEQGFVAEIYKKMSTILEGQSALQMCLDLMQRLQVKFFKYLPSAFFMATEFNHILFCHALPNHNQNILQSFLCSPQQIYLYDRGDLSSFVFSDLGGESGESGELLRDPQTVEEISKFMCENAISLVIRGHQHNYSIRQIDLAANPLNGMIVKAKESAVFTLSSVDFACFNTSVAGLGNPCHFCSITKNDQTLTIDSYAVDRLTGAVRPVDVPTQIQKQVEILDLSKIPAARECLLANPSQLQFLRDLGFVHIAEDVEFELNHYTNNRFIFSGQYVPCFDNILENIGQVRSALSNIFILDISGIDNYLESLGLVKFHSGGYFKAPEILDEEKREEVFSFFEHMELGIPAQIKRFNDMRRQLSIEFAVYITVMRTGDYPNSGIPGILSQMNSIRDRLRFLLIGLGEALGLSREAVATRIAGLVGKREQAI